jgi:hypothetical protein
MNDRHYKLRRAVSLALGAGVALSPIAALAQDSIAALRAQVEQLQARLEQMERQQQAQQLERQRFDNLETKVEALEGGQLPASANVVTGGDRPGTFKLPGSDTSVQIGGYVKLDAIYNPDEDLGDTLFPGNVVTDPNANPSEGEFRFHARQSRLFLKTWTPTSLGEARTHFEADFFGSGGNEVFSNSSNFRIRHAYGELGPYLAGQTWSNFMHFAAYPSTVDFGGPMGVSFIRQAQVRYTMPLGDGKLSVSAENPEATGFAGAEDDLPDLTARYQWDGDNATIETAVVLRRLAYEDDFGSDSEFGYGLMLAGNYRIGDTTLMLGGIYGDGVGRYLYPASGSDDGQSGIGAAYIDDDGSLETIEAYGIVAAIEQRWSPNFRSVLSYGRTEADDKPADRFPEATKTLETIHFSNFWTPVEKVTFGFELARAAKEVQNGDDGDALRVQFSTQYDF